MNELSAARLAAGRCNGGVIFSGLIRAIVLRFPMARRYSTCDNLAGRQVACQPGLPVTQTAHLAQPPAC